jgi:hypothetical protein
MGTDDINNDRDYCEKIVATCAMTSAIYVAILESSDVKMTTMSTITVTTGRNMFMAIMIYPPIAVVSFFK